MNASSSHVGSMSEVQSVQMQAAVQAESMARQMKEILEKFERDQEQASATDTSSASVMTRSLKTKESRPYPTNNPNEDWVVLYDATYNREYYHEKKSGRTQWEPPMVDDDVSGDATSTTSRQSAMLSHAEVKPDVESRPVSRIALYRRKRRRQRKRRLVVASVVLAISIMMGSVWVYKNPESALAKQYVQPIMSKYFGSEDAAAKAKLLQEELAREEADRLRVLEEERLAREEAEKERRLQLEREAAELKARQEAESKAAQEAERKAAQLAEERRLKELAVTEKAKREAELWIQQQEELRRPVACNIPFAYAFNGKCRRLASKNPVFDFQALVESMLQ